MAIDFRALRCPTLTLLNVVLLLLFNQFLFCLCCLALTCLQSLRGRNLPWSQALGDGVPTTFTCLSVALEILARPRCLCFHCIILNPMGMGQVAEKVTVRSSMGAPTLYLALKHH
jgi:hypothetical protein